MGQMHTPFSKIKVYLHTQDELSKEAVKLYKQDRIGVTGLLSIMQMSPCTIYPIGHWQTPFVKIKVGSH